MRFGRIISCLALVVMAFALPLGAAGAQGQGDPRAFMTDIGNRVLKIINDKAAPEAQRKQQFTQLVEGAFDVPRIARFVLGRYWRTASDQEKQQFEGAFETYMISVYWSRFTSYNGEGFKVTGSQDQGSKNVTVTTDIMRPESGQPPVKVTWYLSKSGTSFKIEDASLEGVSQALTYRDEFSSIIEQNGGKVSALISKLNERAKG
jgi:phospholipid transport system substrate-binding protein